MSYSISQMNANFHMKAENLIKAKKALMTTVNFKGARTFMDIMLELGWIVELDIDENVVHIQIDKDYVANEKEFFNIIAPFVEEKSFIQMVGEDGDIWRWVFEDSKCAESYPTIVWPQ